MKKASDNMVDSGVIMINIHDSYQGGVCVGVVPLLTVEMQKAGFFYVDHVIWDKQNNKPQGNDTKSLLFAFKQLIMALLQHKLLLDMNHGY
jgi:DNA modification methylase